MSGVQAPPAGTMLTIDFCWKRVWRKPATLTLPATQNPMCQCPPKPLLALPATTATLLLIAEHHPAQTGYKLKHDEALLGRHFFQEFLQSEGCRTG